MLKRILFVLGSLFLGLIIGYFINFYIPLFDTHPSGTFLSPTSLGLNRQQIIGFLPYWLLSNAQTDYSKYITTLTYFDLTIDTDGSIKKMNSQQEEEPGWYALKSGKVDKNLTTAKRKGVELSLTVFMANNDNIDSLLNDPIDHAKNLTRDVIPVIKKYGFTDLNLDIESTAVASDAARANFTQFTAIIKDALIKNHLATLTVDISPTDFIRHDLIYPRDIGKIADYIVLMTYDYHFPGSYVTGPVAPLAGAGTISEYDTESAVERALAIIPPRKIILGAPVYGYEWETIGNTPRSAVIPDTGIAASTKRIEKLLSECASCSAQIDTTSKESYLIYKDQEFETYHQIFYPTKDSTQAKIDLAQKSNLEGIALWALGYEGGDILQPLDKFK